MAANVKKKNPPALSLKPGNIGVPMTAQDREQVIGTPMFPGFALKAGGFFFFTSRPSRV